MDYLLRKLYRFLGLIFPIFYIIFTKKVALVFLSIVTVIFVFVDIIRLRKPSVNKWICQYLRWIWSEKEKNRISGTTYFLISVLTIILLFPKNIAITACFFSTIGDAFAGLIGNRFGKVKLVNNKTLEGSISFFIACLIVGYFLNLSRIELSLENILIGSLSGAITEQISIKIDDNFTIALVVAIVLFLIKFI